MTDPNLFPPNQDQEIPPDDLLEEMDEWLREEDRRDNEYDPFFDGDW